jgi:hypothetical protein
MSALLCAARLGCGAIRRIMYAGSTSAANEACQILANRTEDAIGSL